VTANDISREGFSFLHSQYVHPGTRLFVRLDKLSSPLTVRAVVLYCQYIDDRQYRIGAHFETLYPTS